jgi:hypothetical protein
MASLIAEYRTGASPKSRFVVTIYLGSFLLFLVQPMIARMVLPRLGGAPAVWNSAMLVYQALLLAGYAYAHWLGRFAPRRQALVHLLAFAAAASTLPIGLIALTPSATANPFFWVPALLLASIGPLFFVVSAQAPLMQRWFALSEGRDPYPLYAASNFGSFLGLIAYPLLVEVWIPLSAQRWLWSGAYALLAIAVCWCAMALRDQPAAAPKPARTPAPSRRQLGQWALLAAVPSGLILSTTLHLTTDIMAMPLLWVIPLGVYLLSFSVAFASRRGPAKFISAIAPALLLLSGVAVFPGDVISTSANAVLTVLNLFTVAVALHTRMYDSRPAEQHLTIFYLAMSAGGVLGGLFCALLAPQIFNWTYEYPILLIAAAALLATRNPIRRFAALWANEALKPRLTAIGIALGVVIAVASLGPFGVRSSNALTTAAVEVLLALAVVALGNRALFATTLTALILVCGGWAQVSASAEPGRMSRSFFGIYMIADHDGARWLSHGTTVHGIENLGSPERERMPTAYYAHGSGVARAMAAAPRLFGDHARIEVVGLGAGTLACYAQPGQQWAFYEIDPAVVRIASDPRRFHFLQRCQPNAKIVIGDARLTLGRTPAASADLLVIDAFSSDAIPMHLLTREAFEVYRGNLKPGGLLMVHITNRFLDIEPVIAAAAANGGWTARGLSFGPSPAERANNAEPSIWIALSQSPTTIERLTADDPKDWRQLRARSGFQAWTDDHASLLPVIKY